jgi:hypothetical protein
MDNIFVERLWRSLNAQFPRLPSWMSQYKSTFARFPAVSLQGSSL